MIGRIIGFFSCAMCALAFWAIASMGKDGKTPISFWSGDNSLKEKIRDVKVYNGKMAALYKKYALSFLVSGAGFFIHPIVGAVLISLVSLFGISIVYIQYKKYLDQYS